MLDSVLPGLDIDTAIFCLFQTSQPSIRLIYDSVDDNYRLLLEDVKNGSPISTYSQALKGSPDILSVSDDLVLLESRRIVLPLPAVTPILKLLHSSHSGVTKITNLARGLYFWPGMTNDIKQLVSTCPDCISVLPSQPANPMVTPSPSSHFSFGGKDYLICVDHWSGYPFYQLLRSLTLDFILKILTSWFNLFGWPSSIRSDGGPQFHGDFSRFCEKHSIRHELSAPYDPKSNGLAEPGVKSVKNILRKSLSSGSDTDFMLYEWCNVPRSDDYSPTQLMFGRAQRTSLPTLPLQIVLVDFNQAASSKDNVHSHAKLDHDKSKLSLPVLSPGQPIYLQDSKSSAWDKQGFIVSMRPDRLSYVINVENRFFTSP